QLRAALTAVRAYEAGLAHLLLEALARRPRFKVWGITDPGRLEGRVPTFALTHPYRTPAQMAERLAARDVYAWNGHLYALALPERLGLEAHGGFLRLGLVHYNTAEEIDRLMRVLDELH